MRRTLTAFLLAGLMAFGSLGLQSNTAEARRSGAVAGVVLGAVIGGIVASEIYRHKRKRYYARHYYGYYPTRAYYAPSYYGYYRPSRRHYYYGW